MVTRHVVLSGVSFYRLQDVARPLRLPRIMATRLSGTTATTGPTTVSCGYENSAVFFRLRKDGSATMAQAATLWPPPSSGTFSTLKLVEC